MRRKKRKGWEKVFWALNGLPFKKALLPPPSSAYVESRLRRGKGRDRGRVADGCKVVKERKRWDRNGDVVTEWKRKEKEKRAKGGRGGEGEG